MTGEDAGPFEHSAIKPIGNGEYRVALSAEERALIRELSMDLQDQLGAGASGDRSMFRLFPPGYSEDLLRQVEFDRLMHDDLQTSHLSALQVLAQTSDSEVLDEATLDLWVRALNQVRLVLGTRLDITEDANEDEPEDDDPRAGAYAVYSYLGYLQDAAVEALSESVDPAGVPGADDLAPGA